MSKPVWVKPSEAVEGVKYNVRRSSGFVAPVPYTKSRIEEENNDPDEPRKIVEISPWIGPDRL